MKKINTKIILEINDKKLYFLDIYDIYKCIIYSSGECKIVKNNSEYFEIYKDDKILLNDTEISILEVYQYIKDLKFKLND